jgi:hypothetical protein
VLLPELAAAVHADPVGVKVYVAEALLCVIVTVCVPLEHVSVKVPTVPVVEVESAWGEVIVKVPPVELDMLTTTLPVFITTESTTEPEVTVRLTAGEVRASVVLALKVSGAA